MADYDQEDLEVCKDVLKTKDGIDRLALHHSSVGRFPNVLGALIYPIYGQGELPQAFCRRAAVKGCLYVLRMPVIALLMDKGSGSYKGVKLSSGQHLFSHQLVLDPSFIVPSPLANSPPDFLHDGSEVSGLRDVQGKVARGICITNSSLKPDVSNFLVVYPPKSLYPEQVTSIRVLQMGSNLAVCPAGMFVLYLSALCDDAIQGKKLLNEAIYALVSVPISGNPENSFTDQNENIEEGKPTLLWSALYIQELTMGSFGNISSTPMPDGNLNYYYLLDATLKLFHKMYPHEEFFPETTSSDKLEDDSGLDVESSS
uniref:Rab escort protein 1 n=1 Tax=Davidia involucrata TaxID=16924 RepID=A0A5B6Z7K9_DAVIN